MNSKTYLTHSTLFCLIIFSSTISFSQKEGSVWYFGVGHGLDFNLGCDIIDSNNNNMNTPEGCAIICDEEGEVLFYSNGGGRVPNPVDYAYGQGAIWNKNHESFYDMMGTQGGGWSSIQSSIIVSKSGSSSNYYLFTMDEIEATWDGTTARGVSYFEIDMNLNGGLGGVVNYQESLALDCNEELAAVKHANGEDSWVVIFDHVLGGFKVFLANSSGVDFSYFEANSQIVATSARPIYFSPSTEKMVSKDVIYDFDASTGQLSNPIFLGEKNLGGMFSPNSKYYYSIRRFPNFQDHLVRFDLESTDILNSEVTIYQEANNSSNALLSQRMQLAPDGNIYFLKNINQKILSGILCPNSENACYRPNILSLPGETTSSSFPNFTNHFFKSDDITRALDICIEADQEEICPGQEALLTAKHYLENDFLWSNGDTTKSIIITEPGIYQVTISDGCCNTGTAEIEILNSKLGELDLDVLGKRDLCEGEIIELTAVSEYADIVEWSNGSNNSSVNISDIGNYSVTVTDICGDSLFEEIEVVYSNPLDIIPSDIAELNCGEELELSIETTANSILWSNGETTSNIFVNEPGEYSVAASNGCVTIHSIFNIDLAGSGLAFPNAFSPNGDGNNDYYFPIQYCGEIHNFEMKIFDRWGQMVFQTNDLEKPWDGNFKGQPMPNGVYVYLATYTDLLNVNKTQVSGDVVVVITK